MHDCFRVICNFLLTVGPYPAIRRKSTWLKRLSLNTFFSLVSGYHWSTILGLKKSFPNATYIGTGPCRLPLTMGMDFCLVASTERICLADSPARNMHFPHWSLSTYVMGRKHRHRCPHWSCGYNLNQYWDLHFSHCWSTRGAWMCPLHQQPGCSQAVTDGEQPQEPQGWVGCLVL